MDAPGMDHQLLWVRKKVGVQVKNKTEESLFNPCCVKIVDVDGLYI